MGKRRAEGGLELVHFNGTGLCEEALMLRRLSYAHLLAFPMFERHTVYQSMAQKVLTWRLASK